MLPLMTPAHPPPLARSRLDPLLVLLDAGLRTVYAVPRARRPYPGLGLGLDLDLDRCVALTPVQRREAAKLMRVNHVGEVCAQALYTAQAHATRNPHLRRHFECAGAEETDHLAWSHQRLTELGGRTSRLNLFWYAGALSVGFVAGKLGGDRLSLGFVVETEHQVEAHLAGHLARLPAEDRVTRAVIEQMQSDEARHAQDAQHAGAHPLPRPLAVLMKLAARVMTTLAYRI